MLLTFESHRLPRPFPKLFPWKPFLWGPRRVLQGLHLPRLGEELAGLGSPTIRPPNVPPELRWPVVLQVVLQDSRQDPPVLLLPVGQSFQ